MVLPTPDRIPSAVPLTLSSPTIKGYSPLWVTVIAPPLKLMLSPRVPVTRTEPNGALTSMLSVPASIASTLTFPTEDVMEMGLLLEVMVPILEISPPEEVRVIERFSEESDPIPEIPSCPVKVIEALLSPEIANPEEAIEPDVRNSIGSWKVRSPSRVISPLLFPPMVIELKPLARASKSLLLKNAVAPVPPTSISSPAGGTKRRLPVPLTLPVRFRVSPIRERLPDPAFNVPPIEMPSAVPVRSI